MDRSQISPALIKARGDDIARIPLATMKVITGPGELAMRLGAYTALVAKAGRPHLEPDLVRGYHRLATEVVTTEDRARAVELMKTAGTAPHYSPPELQRMLRAGTACKLSNGQICPVGNVRDLRYQVTVAQGAVGRGTPEDSSAFRAFLASRARSLGAPQQIPVRWGQPDARPGAVAAGKSAVAKARQAMIDDLAGVAADAVEKALGLPPSPASMVRYWEELAARSPDPGRAALYRRRAADARWHAAGSAAQPAAAGRAPAGKAAEYERKAGVVTDPVMAQAYREMARAEREKAGAR